jgi:hypothetical protein
MRILLIALVFVTFLSQSAPVEAANWVKVVSGGTYGDIYLDTESVKYVDNNIVRAQTKQFDPGGYTVVLERFSLEYNSMQMDAILTYSFDNSLIDWQIIDNKKSVMSAVWGESFSKIDPNADGMKILAYLKEMARRGLIAY